MRLLLLALILAGASLQQEQRQPGPRQEQVDSEARKVLEAQRPVEQADKVATDDALARYTLWLAIFTGLLVLVSGVQGFFIWRADRTARLTATAAKTAADAAVASDRAYVYVNTTETEKRNAVTGPLNSRDVRPIVFGNFGKTPAQLEKWIAYFQYWKGASLGRGGEQSIHGIWLAAGWSTASLFVPVTATDDEIERAKNGDGKIALIGRVVYSDVFGDCHETGFCWAYDFSTHKLTLADGAHLNYNRPVEC